MGGARELCPNLVVLPYEFERYEEVRSLLIDYWFAVCGDHAEVHAVH